jgi:transposase
MSIVGGLDIHRNQITFDVVDEVTGQVWRGQVRPADREHLAQWLAQFAGRGGDLAMEGCTGWRYIAEEVARAGLRPHVGDPAEVAGLRGPKRRAKSDRADARLQRELLAAGRWPECWIPPSHVLEIRALLEAYLDVRTEHTAFIQRIHAVLFHHGAPAVSGQLLASAGGVAALEAAAARCSPAGQAQVALYLRMAQAAGQEMDALRRQLLHASRHLAGARILAGRLYGVGPFCSLALTCWLGGKDRFTSSRQAVRFTGLDVTVHSSDGKRTTGHLSRQGPPVLRWAIYEAAKTHARAGAPDHDYYAQVKDRIDGKRAALSEARKLTRQAMHILDELGDDALAMT